MTYPWLNLIMFLRGGDRAPAERGATTVQDLVQPLPYRRVEDAESVAGALRLAGLRE
jgi:hypothetical protein